MVIHEQMHMLCILPLMQIPYYIENKNNLHSKIMSMLTVSKFTWVSPSFKKGKSDYSN